MAWLASLVSQADDVWQQIVFQWELATAGAQDMQWIDTLDFFWDSLPDGDQLTAREKRQIAATLKLVVRQQSTGYYHKQQGHKEAIMRRQALLQAQQHLEQLAQQRLDEMRTMSHMAREQSRATSSMLPAASALLLAAQPSWHRAAAAAALQAAGSGSSSGSSGGSNRSGSRQWPWQQQQQHVDRGSSSSRLPSLQEGLDQYQYQQQQQLGLAVSMDLFSMDSLQSLQHHGEIQPQQQQQQPHVQSQPLQDASVVIDVPSDHFSFLPLAAAAASAHGLWPAGSGRRGSGSSAGGANRSGGSWSSSGSSRLFGRSGSELGGLSEPLLQQQEQQHGIDFVVQSGCAEPLPAAEAAGFGSTDVSPFAGCDPQQQLPGHAGGSSSSAGVGSQHLPLERYLSSSSDIPHDLTSAAAAAGVTAACTNPTAAATAVSIAKDQSAAEEPLVMLHSLRSDPSVGSSSSCSDASSEHQQQQHQQALLPHQQQQQGGGLPNVKGVVGGVADSRCSCDTTVVDVDTPRVGQDSGGGGCVC